MRIDMAKPKPFYYRRPENRPVSVLAGWDKFTTQKDDGTTPISDHDFTVADLLKILRVFREEFNPARLDEIETLIRKHIDRTDNPHKLDLEDLDTNILQELYKLWLEEGNTGTREDFQKVIFQYVKIADIPTTREGKSYEHVVSAKGLWTVVDDHDKSIDAHEELLKRLFPGEELRTIPTYAIYAYLGLPADAIVKRDSPMWILDDNGTFREIPNDTLEADHCTGEAAFPVFGALTNYIAESEDFTKSFFGFKGGTIERSSAIPSLDADSSPAFIFKETEDATPVRHEVRYFGDNISIVENKIYTISVFVRPNGRDCVGIEIQDAVYGGDCFGFVDSNLQPFDQGPFSVVGTGEYRNVNFDCKKEIVFINSKSIDLTGYIYPCYNGWYRLQVTFRALATTVMQVSICSLDIVDGDLTHTGQTGAGFALYGLMVTEGPSLPPYIPSKNEVLGMIAPTTVEIPVGDWFRCKHGTIVMDCSMVGINQNLQRTHTLYNIADGVNSVTALATFPQGHKNRAYFAGYNENRVVACSGWTPPTTRPWMQSIHGWTPDEHLFGGPLGSEIKPVTKPDGDDPLNDQGKTLYLGCSRHLSHQLDGYIRSFIFYPKMITRKATHFFYGE